MEEILSTILRVGENEAMRDASLPLL